MMGWGYQYFNTIQDAVDAVLPGGTVQVARGRYDEHVIILKTLNLIGEDKYTTIIDGSGKGGIIQISYAASADNVLITGFTIQNGSTVSARAGIEISYESNHIIITDNIIATNYWGIELNDAHECTISKNIITVNNNLGIYLHFYSTNNNIFGNTIAGNRWGIDLDRSGNNKIFSNTFISNTEYGIYTYQSSNNLIYHNNFITNTPNAYDANSNTWDNGYPSGGNYWNDFDDPSEGAYDNNSDGIVDSAYNISGKTPPNQDRYPLINPWEPSCGDCNGDGVIDVGDVVYLLNYLFKNGPAPQPLSLGDVNADTMVDVGDVVFLLNYLFRNGPAP